MTNYFAIIQSQLLEKLSKNNFFTKIDSNTKEFIIYNDNNGVFLIFICDEIELKFKISEFNIYNYTTDVNLKEIINNTQITNDLNKKYVRFKIEIKSFLFMLKISNISRLILIKLEDSINKISFLYDNYETVLEVETEQTLVNLHECLEFNNRHEFNLTKILSFDFLNIMLSHQSISDNKIINDDNQNIQIQIYNNRIKFLSTNYIVGLVHKINNEFVNSENIQLNVNKNIDILKIYQLFRKSEYITLVQRDNKSDVYGRIRSKFIKFQDDTNICYVRLYDSTVNTFDETIIDDQINILSKHSIGHKVIIRIVDTIKEAFEIKKIDIVDILIDKNTDNNIYIKCKSSDYSFNFTLDIKEDIVNKNKLRIKVSGNTINTIYQILNKQNNDCNLNIYVADSGEQGRINYISEYTTDIIFV